MAFTHIHSSENLFASFFTRLSAPNWHIASLKSKPLQMFEDLLRTLVGVSVRPLC